MRITRDPELVGCGATERLELVVGGCGSGRPCHHVNVVVEVLFAGAQLSAHSLARHLHIRFALRTRFFVEVTDSRPATGSGVVGRATDRGFGEVDIGEENFGVRGVILGDNIPIGCLLPSSSSSFGCDEAKHQRLISVDGR